MGLLRRQSMPTPVVVATNLPCLTPLVPVLVGDALDLSGRPAHDHYLEAVVRVQMDVQGGDDRLMV
jgi:hypothetical protein